MRRPVLRLALALALAASTAAAAPLPVSRPFAPLASAPADALGGACGARLDATAALLAGRAARPAAAALATTFDADAGGIAVLEDDGTFFYADKAGRPILDLAAVTRAFYRTHDDDATFLAIYLASGLDQFLGSPTALAAAWPVRNAIDGLGLPHYDYGAALGSAARLETVLTMNGLHRYPDDPAEVFPGDTFDALGILAHEFGHRWLAYTWLDSAGVAVPALLGRDREHWNFFFDCDSSFMEGCDWTAAGPDTFVTTGATTAFGAFDQYLMGLRSKSETPPFFVVNEPADLNPPGVYVPWSIPRVGVTCDGRATWWSVDDVERLNGPRVPDAAAAPHAWRVAFVLVVPHGQAASAADLAKLGALRAAFPERVARATGGRGAVDVTLPSRAGRLAIAHAPLHDRESTAAPLVVGARVARVDGAAPLAAAPDVRVHWRTDASGPFATLALAPAGGDSFAVTLPAVAGTVQYWLEATLAADGLAARSPAAGDAAPYAFTLGPDLSPPTIACAPVPWQGEQRLPQVLLARVTDNTALAQVWCEVSVDGGPVAIVPATAAGGDSFTVAVGAGLTRGHHVAWRFGARDAAAAANVGWSNPGFDTLRVVRDFADDFEHPSLAQHLPAVWSYRDPWRLDTLRSSPAGGTAWHFGGADGEPYEPHADALLYLPWAYGLEPGTQLRFDAWHDFEEAEPGWAWDGWRVEVQAGSPAATPVPAEPVPGYTHVMLSRSLSIRRDQPCWSGASPGWVTYALDLGAWAPGPARLLVHAATDEWLGRAGLWFDRLRVLFPGGGTLATPPAPPPTLACGPARPNPTHGELRLPLALPRAADVEWTLHDVQGRRVATLWRGPAEAGRLELLATAPGALAPGLYFSRVRVAGREQAATRVVLVR